MCTSIITETFLSSRCYDEALANKTMDEVREIYSSYPNPSCTKYRGSPTTGFQNDTGQCDRWIYELDHGYKSMSSEVCEYFFIN